MDAPTETATPAVAPSRRDVKEQKARETIAALQKQIDGLKTQAYRTLKVRRYKNGTVTVRCAYCGGDDFAYMEDIQNYRQVEGIGEEGQLQIQGFYETENCDDGDNPRLICHGTGCGETNLIPKDLELDWI